MARCPCKCSSCGPTGRCSTRCGEASMRTWLVIGIGNTLRRDDGLGPWLAERVAGWDLAGVTVRVVPQLTPELAVELADHDGTLLLDASRSAEPLRFVTIAPSARDGALGHAFSPGEVLALAARLSGHSSPVWLMPVVGSDFDFGER